MSRIWVPIVLIRDKNGDAILDWFKQNAWKVESSDRKVELNTCFIQEAYGECAIDIIATIEAGYCTPTHIPYAKATALANFVCESAVCSISWQTTNGEIMTTVPLRDVLMFRDICKPVHTTR